MSIYFPIYPSLHYFCITPLSSHLSIYSFIHTKAQVVKEQLIADSTSELRKSYYCELCDKQYSKYSEYDNHLNSYDHHHRQVSIMIGFCSVVYYGHWSYILSAT